MQMNIAPELAELCILEVSFHTVISLQNKINNTSSKKKKERKAILLCKSHHGDFFMGKKKHKVVDMVLNLSV